MVVIYISRCNRLNTMTIVVKVLYRLKYYLSTRLNTMTIVVVVYISFFASDERIKAVRKMIMAVTIEHRKAALDLLFPYQRSDFEGIFRAMDGLPVTIRLLDPPLHEFLPEGDLDQIVGELTKDTGMTEDEIYSRIEKLSEVNPMRGFRGCRANRGASARNLSSCSVYEPPRRDNFPRDHGSVSWNTSGSWHHDRDSTSCCNC